jgi:DNA adenine methylase
MDVRYNASELINRVETVANVADRISLTRQDALTFLKRGKSKWPAKTLVYLDPPYYVKGRSLYLDFYGVDDHAKIADLLLNTPWTQKWIVSYDDVPEISGLYQKAKKINYGLAYSAREVREGREVMFFSKGLTVPSIALGRGQVAQIAKRA